MFKTVSTEKGIQSGTQKGIQGKYPSKKKRETNLQGNCALAYETDF